MIFLITKTTENVERDCCPTCVDDPTEQRRLCPDRPHETKAVKDSFTWTLCRKEKGQPGDPICQSIESYASERQCRSAINTAKRAMAGVRFAQTQVASDDA